MRRSGTSHDNRNVLSQEFGWLWLGLYAYVGGCPKFYHLFAALERSLRGLPRAQQGLNMFFPGLETSGFRKGLIHNL